MEDIVRNDLAREGRTRKHTFPSTWTNNQEDLATGSDSSDSVSDSSVDTASEAEAIQVTVHSQQQTISLT